MNYSHFICGDWGKGTGQSFQSIDPATGEVVWQGPAATEDEVAIAVTAAREAFEAWSGRSLEERIGFLRRFAEQVKLRKPQLSEAISREVAHRVGLPAEDDQAMVWEFPVEQLQVEVVVGALESAVLDLRR